MQNIGLAGVSQGVGKSFHNRPATPMTAPGHFRRTQAPRCFEQCPLCLQLQPNLMHRGELTRWADSVAKLFWAFRRAILIQDQAAMRNVASQATSPRFDCFKFLVESRPASSFAT